MFCPSHEPALTGDITPALDHRDGWIGRPDAALWARLGTLPDWPGCGDVANPRFVNKVYGELWRVQARSGSGVEWTSRRTSGSCLRAGALKSTAASLSYSRVRPSTRRSSRSARSTPGP
jgi:hypothetical protein